MKILLVQDEPPVSSIQTCLLGRGHEVVRCGGMAEARGHLPAENFDLALLNVRKVDLESIGLGRSLRENKSQSRCFVVLILQPDQAKDAKAFLGCAPDDIWIGPLPGEVLELKLGLVEEQIKRGKERQRIEEMISTRAQQQVALAALGQSALGGVELQTIRELVTTFIMQMLAVDFCHILELSPGGKWFRFEAGYGWGAGYVGKMSEVPGTTSALGHTLLTQEPVIVADLSKDSRFPAADFLREHGVVSGLNVAIKGKGGTLGLVGAFTRAPRVFLEEDLHFVEGLANVLGAAIQRQRSDAEIQKLAAFPRRNPGPVLELGAAGDVSYDNDAAQQLARSLGKKKTVELLPAGYPELVRECLLRGSKREHELVRVQGRVLSWHFYPISESDVVHAYATDVTEQQNLQNQVQHLQRLESVGQLAAGLAHDYNNVLTIIHGHVTLVLGDATLPPHSAKSLKTALDAVERAANLTRQLLVFSRKESMLPEALEINTTIGNVVKLLDRVLGENVHLAFEPGAKLPAVQADPGLLEQVVINLAVNARDAMPRGGKLVLKTFLTTIGPEHTKHNPEARPGEFLALQVTDTGCGMDAATLDRIFEPFFTTKAPGKGTGLGLATVYGIVKQHQGWTEVRSQVGQGTTFTLFFPALVQAAKASSQSAKPALPRGRGERILLVEDEPTLRGLARMLLEDLGYQVTEAGSASEALEQWGRHKDEIQVLLTDLVIPEGLTGFELAERFQRDRPRLKVLVTSGYDAEMVSRGLLAKQAVHFIQKPYRAETLAIAVRQCLEEMGGHSSTVRMT